MVLFGPLGWHGFRFICKWAFLSGWLFFVGKIFCFGLVLKYEFAASVDRVLFLNVVYVFFFFLLFVSVFEYKGNVGWKCYKWLSQVVVRWLLYIEFCTVKIRNKFGYFSYCLRNIGHLVNTSYFLVKLCIVGYNLAIEKGFFYYFVLIKNICEQVL